MVKMIASWGSGGAGKGVVGLALAAQLADRGKNVVVVNAGRSTPVLPVFLPKQHIPASGSLGELLSAPSVNYSSLKGHIHIHPDSNRIGFMGLVSGETPITYKAFQRDMLINLLHVLNDSPFHYVLFDCQENPVFDPLTQLALQTAEYALRILTPDVRGIEFEKAQKGWLSGIADMRVDGQIRIINPVYPVSPLEDMLAASGSAEYVLPFSNEVYGRHVAGQLLRGHRDKYGIQFDKQISRLAERIIRDEGYIHEQS